MVQRLEAAAHDLFAGRGFAATTTREIARLAGVSETLLFRYYGDKAGLFDAVVTAPFKRLMDDFVQRHPGPAADDDRATDMRRFTRQVYELFEANETMFRALLNGPAGDGIGSKPSLAGLIPFFDEAVNQVARQYSAAGQIPPIDLTVGVRLGMGMIASSVLMREMLFFDHTPGREAVITALAYTVEHALSGPLERLTGA